MSINFFKNKMSKFFLIGGLSTCIDISLYIVLASTAHLQLGLSSAASFLLSSLINFNLNNTITFKESHKTYNQKMFTFYLVSAGGLLINYLLINQLIAWDIQYVLAKIVVVGLVVLYNYTLHSRLTYA